MDTKNETAHSRVNDGVHLLQEAARLDHATPNAHLLPVHHTVCLPLRDGRAYILSQPSVSHSYKRPHSAGSNDNMENTLSRKIFFVSAE